MSLREGPGLVDAGLKALLLRLRNRKAAPSSLRNGKSPQFPLRNERSPQSPLRTGKLPAILAVKRTSPHFLCRERQCPNRRRCEMGNCTDIAVAKRNNSAISVVTRWVSLRNGNPHQCRCETEKPPHPSLRNGTTPSSPLQNGKPHQRRCETETHRHYRCDCRYDCRYDCRCETETHRHRHYRCETDSSKKISSTSATIKYILLTYF
jgi:hypothetical protein